MSPKIHVSPGARGIAWTFTLVYFASYLLRINFAVMIVKICAEMALPKSSLAVVVTALTVAYGIGQVISGLMGDKIKPQLMLTVGIGVAVACNLAMFFAQTVPVMTAVWCINGFAHAMLWPPMVRMMSTYLQDSEYSYAVVCVSCGSSIATILLYLGCPLLLKLTDWRTIMLICAACGLLILVFWVIVSPRLFAQDATVRKQERQEKAPGEHLPLPRFVILPTVLIMLGIILQGVLRDGVTNWMPSFLNETFGMPEENAIFSTVILAIFSMVSFMAFDFVQRKWFQNEVFCAAMIFVLSGICSAVLYVTNLLGGAAFVTMLLMAVIVACMHGVNLMLISVVPKRFLKTGKVSTFSGILNACTYIGASLSTYGFAALAERFGWSFTILMWVVVSVLGVAVCLCATPRWRRFRRDFADVESLKKESDQ